MQRSKVKKQFSFDNNKVINFIQENRDNSSTKLLSESIGKGLNLKTKLQEKTLEEQLNFSNSTPKNLKNLKMPAKDKAEKMLKNKYDAKTLIDYAKDLNTHYFDKTSTAISLSDGDMFVEKISQSEKTNCGYYLNKIEQLFQETKLRDEYLLFLGCQVTPDLNANTFFSKTSLKENKTETRKKNTGNKVTNKTESNISPKKIHSENSKDCLNKNSTKAKDRKSDKNLFECEENRNQKEIINFKNDNSANNFTKEKTQPDFCYPQTNSSSLRSKINSSEFVDLFADIKELMNNFNKNKEFLLKYLNEKKSCNIEGRDSDFNIFKISNAQLFSHLHSIDFDMDNSYSKMANCFSSKIVNFFIPTHVHMSFNNQNEEENRSNLKKLKANWIFSIKVKGNEQTHKSPILDNIQIYF